MRLDHLLSKENREYEKYRKRKVNDRVLPGVSTYVLNNPMVDAVIEITVQAFFTVYFSTIIKIG